MIDKNTMRANATGSSRSILIISLLLLIGGIIGVYSNHFHNEFHFDDAHAVVNNAFIRDLKNIPRFFTDATTFSSLPSNQSYRPIVSTTLAIDYWLGGKLAPFWFQVSDFIWFIASVLLLGYLTYQLLETTGRAPHNIWLASIAAGWFGLLPANADTVNYIIARSDVLSTFAVLGSFALYQFFPSRRRSYAFVLPAAIGILAKPTAGVFALLFAVYWLLFDERRESEQRTLAQRVGRYLRAVGPVFLICGVPFVLVQRLTPKTWVAGATDAHQYLITQPYVVLQYFKTFFWPSGLSADYDLAAFHSTDNQQFWVGLGFLVLVLGGAILAAAWRRTRVMGFGLLWFLIALLPTSLWPLAEVMNSHRTFFPYMGLIITAAGLAVLVLRLRIWGSGMVKIVALAGLVVLLGGNAFGTYQRNKVWRNEETLWRDVAIKSPENGRGLMNYGNTLMAKGDFQQALDYFHRAQRLTPLYSTLFINIAIAESALGQPVAAEQNFKQALRLAPNNPNSFTYYARWLMACARVAEARELLRQALGLSPGDLFAQDLLQQRQTPVPNTSGPLRPGAASPETYVNLSLQYYNQQCYPEAIVAAEQALQLRPGFAAAYNNICAAYNQLGQYAKAATAGEQALRYQPDFPLASNNLQYARHRLNAP